MDSVIIGGVALAFLAVGLGVGMYLGKLGVASARAQARQEGETELATIREQLRGAEGLRSELKATLAAAGQAALGRQEELRRVGEERARLAAELEAERKAAKERGEEAIRNREQVRAEVEKLAGRLLDEKG